jgi:hypothetical protein
MNPPEINVKGIIARVLVSQQKIKRMSCELVARITGAAVCAGRKHNRAHLRRKGDKAQ